MERFEPPPQLPPSGYATAPNTRVYDLAVPIVTGAAEPARGRKRAWKYHKYVYKTFEQFLKTQITTITLETCIIN